MYNRAFEEMEQAVRDGDVLCIFPEGQITYDGELSEFKPGIDKLLAREPAPDPIPADQVTAKVLQDRVLELRGDKK